MDSETRLKITELTGRVKRDHDTVAIALDNIRDRLTHAESTLEDLTTLAEAMQRVMERINRT